MTALGEFKILVVDDDEANRYYKAHVLTKRGYRVLEAGRGADALRIVDAERPAVVLLDVRLPDANGIEVCGEIKTRQPGTFVLQTSAAFTRGKDRAAGLVGGADSYLIEPIEPDELLATVDSLLRLHRAERELRLLNDVLEQRVAERTRDLVEANRRLAAESENRVKIEAALHHVQKLDAIGQLTGGVAHDFNNLLTVVLGNLEMVEQELGRAGTLSRQKLNRFATAARSAAEGCERLTRQLLAFGRRDVLRTEVLSPDEVINRFEALLRRALGEPVKLTLALAAGNAFCRVDAGQLEATLLNLAVNARDAMTDGGLLKIAARNSPLDGDYAAQRSVKPGYYVQITIEDTGTGMAPDVLEKVFEPFFTTKGAGRGTGLGLAQVYGFAQQSGGTAWVRSQVGQGTRVHLLLPRSERELQAETSRPATPLHAKRRSDLRILVVEDEPAVAAAVLDMLGQLGHRGRSVGTVASALALLANGNQTDLVLSDVLLPGGDSGLDLAREVRQRHLGLPVILTSGYGGTMTQRLSAMNLPFLRKPYDLETLRETIDAAMQVPVPTA